MSVTCNGCGKPSTTSDYCSECGDAITAASSTSLDPAADPLAATASGGATDKCPVCSGDREDPTGQFCDVCGYDFVNKVGGEVAPDPVPATSTAASTTQPAAPVAAQPNNLGPRLTIEFITAGAPNAKFTLFEEENLIGRKSASVPQTVKLATNDTAISRRQLMVTRQADGTWTVRDLVQGGNTVKVSPDKVLAEGEEYTLSVGTVLEVGDSSQIKIVAINS